MVYFIGLFIVMVCYTSKTSKLKPLQLKLKSGVVICEMSQLSIYGLKISQIVQNLWS